MKTLTLAEAKTKFSSVMKEVVLGEEIAVSYGKKKDTIAVIVPYKKWINPKKTKRKLGILEHLGQVTFADNWHISDEELMGA